MSCGRAIDGVIGRVVVLEPVTPGCPRRPRVLPHFLPDGSAPNRIGRSGELPATALSLVIGIRREVAGRGGTACMELITQRSQVQILPPLRSESQMSQLEDSLCQWGEELDQTRVKRECPAHLVDRRDRTVGRMARNHEHAEAPVGPILDVFPGHPIGM